MWVAHSLLLTFKQFRLIIDHNNNSPVIGLADHYYWYPLGTQYPPNHQPFGLSYLFLCRYCISERIAHKCIVLSDWGVGQSNWSSASASTLFPCRLRDARWFARYLRVDDALLLVFYSFSVWRTAKYRLSLVDVDIWTAASRLSSL